MSEELEPLTFEEWWSRFDPANILRDYHNLALSAWTAARTHPARVTVACEAQSYQEILDILCYQSVGNDGLDELAAQLVKNGYRIVKVKG